MLHKATDNHFGVFVVNSSARRTDSPHLLVPIRHSQFRRASTSWAERDPRLGHRGGRRRRRGGGGAGAGAGGVGGRHPERAETGGGDVGVGQGRRAADEEAGGVGQEEVVGSEEEHGGLVGGGWWRGVGDGRWRRTATWRRNGRVRGEVGRGTRRLGRRRRCGWLAGCWLLGAAAGRVRSPPVR